MIISGIKWKCEGLFQATAIETIYDGTSGQGVSQVVNHRWDYDTCNWES